MPNFRSDVLIKNLRKSKGLTQDQLCDGICTKDSLSRIEQGKRRPGWHIFMQLMQRLGEDPHKYYSDIVSVHEKEIMDMKDEIVQLLRVKNTANYDAARLLITEMEQNGDFTKGVNLQFLLRQKAAVASYDKDFAAMYDYAAQAVMVTKPDFFEDDIHTYLLTYEEIWSIIQIAIASASTVSVEKAAEIYLKLKTAVDRGYMDDDEKIKTYIPLLYNLTTLLGQLKRYEEGLQLCNEGIELCRRYRNAYYHPMMLFNKACCLFFLGRMEEGADPYTRACALFAGDERDAELAMIKEYAKKEFGIAASYPTETSTPQVPAQDRT